MRSRVTSLDVAARAGVSQSAVSRVFSGASASAKTKAKVREAAEVLGYRPNTVARSLITGRSHVIGLVVAYLENAFYPDALERFSHVLQERGYHILVFMASGRGEGVDEVIERMLDRQVDGIITASVGVSDELTEMCRAAGIPVVLFNRGQPGGALSQVTSDNRGGAALVADHLIECGYTRLAHISGWSGSLTGQDRAQGFVDRLAQLGTAPVAVEDGLFKRDHAGAVACEMMRKVKPDAIFVGNDHMALGVMDALRHEMGLDVPGDVAVVGYDDVAMASWGSYDLTTVRQPSGQMVAQTVEALLDQIEGELDHPQAIEIPGHLVVRGSTQAPQAAGAPTRKQGTKV